MLGFAVCRVSANIFFRLASGIVISVEFAILKK